MEQLLTKIFKEEFPETLFLYKSEGFSLNEAMSPSGLLPAFVEQALSMASVLGPQRLSDVTVIPDRNGLLSKRAVFGPRALPQLTLLFLLDAGHLALSETLRVRPDAKGLMDVESIIPPIMPHCLDLLRVKPAMAPKGADVARPEM